MSFGIWEQCVLLLCTYGRFDRRWPSLRGTVDHLLRQTQQLSSPFFVSVKRMAAWLNLGRILESELQTQRSWEKGRATAQINGHQQSPETPQGQELTVPGRQVDITGPDSAIDLQDRRSAHGQPSKIGSTDTKRGRKFREAVSTELPRSARSSDGGASLGPQRIDEDLRKQQKDNGRQAEPSLGIFRRMSSGISRLRVQSPIKLSPHG